MKARRVAIIVGTRPEVIKMAPVIIELRERSTFDITLISTGQHREMLDQTLGSLGLVPDCSLDLMEENQTLVGVFASVISSIRTVLVASRPDAVLVHGDTTTCLASALSAFYERIPIGHVEAGLRTYDFMSPWPEEMNRRLTDPLCRWCFAPTLLAADNLRREHISEEKIFVTGNTAVDALLLAVEEVRKRGTTVDGVPESVMKGKRIILVTSHRRESFGEPLRDLCLALRDVVRLHSDVLVVYPVHLNPSVQIEVHSTLTNEERVILLPPMEYFSFVALLQRSTLIVTDSGGIQEEAPSLGKPVLVVRGKTERGEASELGLARVIGTDRETVAAEISRVLADADLDRRMAQRINPYGDGLAAKRIAAILEEGISAA